MVQREQASLSSLSGRVLLLVLTGTDRSAARSSVSVRAETFEMFVVFFFLFFLLLRRDHLSFREQHTQCEKQGVVGVGFGG